MAGSPIPLSDVYHGYTLNTNIAVRHSILLYHRYRRAIHLSDE